MRAQALSNEGKLETGSQALRSQNLKFDHHHGIVMAAAHGCEQNLLHVNTYLKEESAKNVHIFFLSYIFFSFRCENVSLLFWTEFGLGWGPGRQSMNGDLEEGLKSKQTKGNPL